MKKARKQKRITAFELVSTAVSDITLFGEVTRRTGGKPIEFSCGIYGAFDEGNGFWRLTAPEISVKFNASGKVSFLSGNRKMLEQVLEVPPYAQSPG